MPKSKQAGGRRARAAVREAGLVGIVTIIPVRSPSPTAVTGTEAPCVPQKRAAVGRSERAARGGAARENRRRAAKAKATRCANRAGCKEQKAGEGEQKVGEGEQKASKGEQKASERELIWKRMSAAVAAGGRGYAAQQKQTTEEAMWVAGAVLDAHCRALLAGKATDAASRATAAAAAARIGALSAAQTGQDAAARAAAAARNTRV